MQRLCLQHSPQVGACGVLFVRVDKVEERLVQNVGGLFLEMVCEHRVQHEKLQGRRQQRPVYMILVISKKCEE